MQRPQGRRIPGPIPRDEGDMILDRSERPALIEQCRNLGRHSLLRSRESRADEHFACR
jgi:hypothetical protein